MVNLFFILCGLLKIRFIYMNSFSTNKYKKNIQKPSNPSNIENNYSNIKKKNLIISVLVNYKWKIIAPFFISYAKSGFHNCDCIIFVYNISKSTITKIKSFGVIVYDIPKKFKYKKITYYRWKIYNDFLISNKNKYNLVFSTDIRDVFFQKDVFQYYNDYSSFLGIALEAENLSQSRNKQWLISAYGFDLYKKIKNQRIICLGTVWGTIDKLIEFSNIIWKQLDTEWSIKHNVRDQAVANFLIYHDKMFQDYLIRSDNKNGPVMTLALLRKKKDLIHFDIDDNIINGNGMVAAVIHQYDRIPQIVKKVMNKYYPEIIYIKKSYNYIIIFLIFFMLALKIILKGLLYKLVSRKISTNHKI